MRPHAVVDETERRTRDLLRKLLTDDHAHIERLLDSIAATASSGDAFDLREEWQTFDQAVTRHLDAEERDIFPAFARYDPQAAEMLLRQHKQIRAAATEVGLGVDLHCVRDAQVRTFVAMLRTHGRHEDNVLYPWAALHLGESARRRVFRTLMARKVPLINNSNCDHWTIDSETSTLGFSLRHIVVQEIRGRFTRWGGTIAVDRDDPARSNVHVWIDLASIDTGEHERDAHLRSSEFFDLQHFALATFVSTEVLIIPGLSPRVRGRLDLHGVNGDVELDVIDQRRWSDGSGAERLGYSVKARLDRRKFGLRWNQDLDVGGIVVGDQIEVVAHLEAISAKS